MGFFVLRARDDAAKWANLIDMLPASLRDVHFSAQFMAAQSLLGHDPRLAVYTYQDYVVVQPIIVRDIEIGGKWTGYRDIASAIGGFGGPASNHGGTLYSWFSESFTAWCRDNKIVSEFCALHPMLIGHQKTLLASGPALCERKQVVVMDLARGDMAGYRDDRVARIKAAQKANVVVRALHRFRSGTDPDPCGTARVEATPAAFIALYTETMMRKCAAQRWFLPREYLEALRRSGVVFCAFMPDGSVESASLLIGRKAGDNSTAYYHLTGNALRNPKAGANDLLICEMAAWAKLAGFRWLHLGGGVTSAQDDSLLAYKAGFSDQRRPAMSYFRVFNPSAYRQLCADKAVEEIDATGAEFATTFEPMYRREAV